MNAALLDHYLLQETRIPDTDLNVTPTGYNLSESGLFNVFNSNELLMGVRNDSLTVYPCRFNYKISLLKGFSRAEYADKVIEIEPNALVFSTPKIPFYWTPQYSEEDTTCCVFSAEFLLPVKSGVVLDELPIFKAGGFPVFQLSAEETGRAQAIFQRMEEELSSNYAYKYDLLRTYVLELIHFGQKLQPAPALHPVTGASGRVSSLFAELLERQFPIETPAQQLRLRTAKEYADQLAVHVNHLNKVLKETTGRTTTELISNRIVQEAKVLLRRPDWTIIEVADSLGFTDVAHFSKFFKQQMTVTPGAYRTQLLV